MFKNSTFQGLGLRGINSYKQIITERLYKYTTNTTKNHDKVTGSLSICMSVCLSVFLSVYLLVCSSICLSVLGRFLIILGESTNTLPREITPPPIFFTFFKN